ncbi:hypothetical protein G7046_g1532 [Stylonectria norvegica]|nr:hypothetical protein G7046_g1532 [Stylonectria norvegica]
MDVRELTISLVHKGYKDKTLSAAGLTAAYLDRIESLDKNGPRINATMAISTTALEEASALDDYLRETGHLKGRLHGIPILVKDQADTKGLTTTYGSAVAKNNVPDEDATVVRKLKEAGAIVLGKTTMAEWAAVWFSVNSASGYEFTKNPYNFDHDVGGSSGGSAAALASNLAMLAVAEDTGGSIRVPASFCNIVGIRVTPGLISRAGFCPLIKVQDTPGPMARTVTDCALMLDCMIGFDPRDDFTGIAATAAALGLPERGSYASGLDQGEAKLKAAKIGILRQAFGADSDPYCKAVNTVVERALSKIRKLGTTFVDVSIENLEEEAAYTQTYHICSRSDINGFLATKPNLPQDIADILPERPPQDKPYQDLMCKVAHGPEDPRSDPTYIDRLLRRDALKRKVDSVIASHGLDALVFPDAQIPPPRIEDATNGRFKGKAFPTNTFLSSQTRLPAVTVPAGFTDDGLPVGLELVGLEYQEQKLLELARGVEVMVNARQAPSSFR